MFIISASGVAGVGGPYFSLTVPIASIGIGSALQATGVTGSFGLAPCDARACSANVATGQLISVLARTSDVAVFTGASVTQFTTFVPEPATWAMLILGIGAIGAIARRRPRQAGYVSTAS